MTVKLPLIYEWVKAATDSQLSTVLGPPTCGVVDANWAMFWGEPDPYVVFGHQCATVYYFHVTLSYDRYPPGFLQHSEAEIKTTTPDHLTAVLNDLVAKLKDRGGR